MTLSVVILHAKEKPDGSNKIRISIAHNGQTRYIVTRFVVPSSNCIRNGRVIGVGNATYINNELSSTLSKIDEIYGRIPNAEYFSCPQLVVAIKNELYKKKLVSFDEIAEEWLKTKEVQCKQKSMVLYRDAIRIFDLYAGKNFPLSILNGSKVVDFYSWMERKGYSTTTMSMKMSVLQRVLSFAIRRGYVSYDVSPFIDYKEKPKVSREIALSISQLRSIRDCNPHSRSMKFFKDVFMLSFYLCGMNIVDLFSLQFDSESVKYRRTKTELRTNNRKTEFTIQPEAQDLICKFLSPKGYLLYNGSRDVVVIHSKIHYAIKQFRKFIGIDNLYFYSARKTFAQIAAELGVQERLISYCIGDAPGARGYGSSIGYYVNLNKKMADKAIRRVFDYVASDYDDIDEYIEYEQTKNIAQKE